MKKIYIHTVQTVICVMIFSFLCNSVALAEEKIIGMLVEKENTATYIETLDGFRNQLSEAGVDYTFIERNARKSRDKMKIIAKEFAGNVDLDGVIVLGSSAVSIVNKHVKNKPVIFGGVNHPGGLGISGDNITGSTYYIAPSTVINLVKKLSPSIKKIGMLYEPPEQNAASLIEVPETESALKEHGIEFVKESVMVENDIESKTKILIEHNVEYIIIPTNKLLYNNIDLIRSVSDKAQVPIISFSKKGVVNGALISITSNNVAQGRKMADMLIDIMEKGKSPDAIHWGFPSKYTIFISEKTRAALGMNIPNKIYNIATVLHRESNEGTSAR